VLQDGEVDPALFRRQANSINTGGYNGQASMTRVHCKMERSNMPAKWRCKQQQQQQQQH
jgi:hypothetical protein